MEGDARGSRVLFKVRHAAGAGNGKHDGVLRKSHASAIWPGAAVLVLTMVFQNRTRLCKRTCCERYHGMKPMLRLSQ